MKIKGNMSYSTDGEFRSVKNIGYIILVSSSLKKLISSNKPIINTNAKKIPVTSSKILRKLIIRNL